MGAAGSSFRCTNAAADIGNVVTWTSWRCTEKLLRQTTKYWNSSWHSAVTIADERNRIGEVYEILCSVHSVGEFGVGDRIDIVNGKRSFRGLIVDGVYKSEVRVVGVGILTVCRSRFECLI